MKLEDTKPCQFNLFSLFIYCQFFYIGFHNCKIMEDNRDYPET